MGEVQGENVQKVQNQDDLRPEVVMLDKENGPCPVKQVKGGKVPANVFCYLQSVCDTVSIVDCWHKDLSDKEDLHQ